MTENTDSLTRYTCDTLNLRAYAVTTLGVVREITALHNTTPNATVALGRSLTAAALMSATLKPDSDQSLLLKIEGTGPIREIHTQADARGNIRGYAANPRPDETENIGAISASKTIGAGFLTLRRDIGLKEPYTGIVPLQSGEVAVDLAYYLSVSEQIPSAVIIALTLEKDGGISSSGGILIQVFPGTSDETINQLEHTIASMPTGLSDTLRKGSDIKTYLGALFNGEPVKVLDSHPLRASCRCDRNLIRNILQGLSIKDLQEMHDQDRGAEVSCTFCAKKYHYSAAELALLIKKKRSRGKSDEPGDQQTKLH